MIAIRSSRLADPVSAYRRVRPDLGARLAELPRIRAALALLDDAIKRHRAAIVTEEDSAGQKLREIAGTIRSYVESLEAIGPKVAEADRMLGEMPGHGRLGWLWLIPVFAGLVTAIIGAHVVITDLNEREKAKAQLVTTYDELSKRGTDSQVLRALSGVYDGLGGQFSQVGDTLIRVGIPAAIVFFAWKFVTRAKRK